MTLMFGSFYRVKTNLIDTNEIACFEENEFDVYDLDKE